MSGQRQSAFGIRVVLPLFGWQQNILQLSTNSELQTAGHGSIGHPLVTPGLDLINHRSGKVHLTSISSNIVMSLDRTGLNIFWEHVISGLRRLGDLNRWLDPQFVTLQRCRLPCCDLCLFSLGTK